MEKPRKKIGLALGSGAIRGLAHIGVIKSLIANGIPIDYIAGSSIGGWIGAHYALYQDIQKLEEDTIGRKKEKLFSIWEPTWTGGFIKGNKFERLVSEWLHEASFADAKIPLQIVATDLVSGEPFVFKDGPLAIAIRSSVSVPSLFRPIRHEDKILVDGGVSDPVPDALVRAMGADIVISINLDDCVKNEKFLDEKGHYGNAAERSLNIMRHHLAQRSMRDSDIVVEPYTPVIGFVSFRDYFNKDITSSLVASGATEMEKYIPKLKELMLR